MPMVLNAGPAKINMGKDSLLGLNALRCIICVLEPSSTQFCFTSLIQTSANVI